MSSSQRHYIANRSSSVANDWTSRPAVTRAAGLATLPLGSKPTVLLHGDNDLRARRDGKSGLAVVAALERDAVRHEIDRAVRKRLRGVVASVEVGDVRKTGQRRTCGAHEKRQGESFEGDVHIHFFS